jgi:antitoxin PrlF
MFNLQQVIGGPLDMLRDLVSVSGSKPQSAKDQHVQRPLQQLDTVGGFVRHGSVDILPGIWYYWVGSLPRGSVSPYITVVICPMAIGHSRVTAQGQISVPANVRRKLGIGPGSVLEWEEEGDRIVVRRAGRFSSKDIHRALFGSKEPEPKSLDELKEGIRRYARKRYARS